MRVPSFFCMLWKGGGSHGVLLCCSETWEWSQGGNCTFCKYIIVLSACDDTLYTHKVVSRLACSNYVRFFCWGRFLTCGFCLFSAYGNKGDRIWEQTSMLLLVPIALLFPWITQNNMDRMASGPTCPVRYITFFVSWSYNPVNDNNFWYHTDGKKQKNKKRNMLEVSSEISDF